MNSATLPAIGQELNELAYSTLQLGNHVPVEQIEKIEIIRGPGSVIYGGFAELAVINVTTRGAKELDGIAVSGTYGQLPSALGRRNLSIQAGREIKSVPGLSASASFFVGEGNRSDTLYRDLKPAGAVAQGHLADSFSCMV